MGCSCGSDGMTLLYACSGAANTGLLADRVARQLAVGGGKMTCLAAVGAGLETFLAGAGCAKRNVVLDGCPVACGRAIFESRDLPFEHVLLTEYGVEKGKTVITDELVGGITGRIAADKALS